MKFDFSSNLVPVEMNNLSSKVQSRGADSAQARQKSMESRIYMRAHALFLVVFFTWRPSSRTIRLHYLTYVSHDTRTHSHTHTTCAYSRFLCDERIENTKLTKNGKRQWIFSRIDFRRSDEEFSTWTNGGTQCTFFVQCSRVWKRRWRGNPGECYGETDAMTNRRWSK